MVTVLMPSGTWRYAEIRNTGIQLPREEEEKGNRLYRKLMYDSVRNRDGKDITLDTIRNDYDAVSLVLVHKVAA